MKSDLEYVTKGGFWWAINRGGVFLLSLAVMYAFSRWETKEIFGQYNYVLSIAAILSILTLPGINTALVRAVAKGYEKTVFLAARARVLGGFLASAVGFSIAAWYLVHSRVDLAIVFGLAALFMPLNGTLNQISFYYWEGKKRFDKSALYTIAFRLFLSAALITAVVNTDSLATIVGAYFISIAAISPVLFALTARKVNKKSRVEKEAIPFGKHLSVMRAAEIVGSYIDKVLLWQIVGPVQLAIYSFAQLPVSRMYQALPIQQLALPKMSERKVGQKSVFKYFSAALFLSALLAGGLILIAPWIYGTFFSQYAASVPLFQVLVIGVVFSPFILLRTQFVARMNNRALYVTRVVPPVTKIVLLALLGLLYGVWGVVAAVLMTQAIEALLILIFFLKET